MLARRTPLLLSRRLAPVCVTAPAAISTGFHARRGLACPNTSNGVVSTQKRTFMGQALASELAVHATQLGGCLQLQTLLYSPLGTAMLLVLAYNVVVIGTKHVNFTMEITAKDYVQDQQLYVIMRYGILSCILLGMEVMFVEV